MENENKYSLKKLTLIFTAIFAVCAVGIYFVYIVNDKTLLRFEFANKDSFSQRYMFIFEFKRFLSNLFADGTVNTWDWSIGLGTDGFAFNTANLLNPFSYLMAFSPAKYVDVVFTATVIMRLYLTGFCFMLFARKINLSNTGIIFGATLYTFSPWIIHASLVQATFLLAPIMLPLVLLGVEKVLRKESPALFILSVGYTIITTFFFAYIIGIITLIYFFIRRLTYDEGKTVKEFFVDTGKFIGFGIVGIMISAIGTWLTVVKYFASTSSTGKSVPLMMTQEQLLRMPMKLVDWITIFGSDSMIGLAPICLVLLPAIFMLALKRKANAIIALLMLIGAAIPYVNSAFNFFSYPSGRWMFAITFFIVLSAMECLDSGMLEKTHVKILTLAFMAGYTGYLLWLQKILTPNELKLVIVNFVVAAIVTIVVLIGKRESKELLLKKAVPAITVIGLVAAYNASWGLNNEGYEGPDGYLSRGQAQSLLAETPQRIGPKIKDSDFYRIDQVDEVTGIRMPHGKMNEAMYFGNRTNYVFYSSVNADWLRYNKLLGNNMGYYKRVAPNSNDNRFGLDFLSGTKYFIGSDAKHKDASNYAGYGFEYDKSIDGTEVLKSKYNMGLGCAYYYYMHESDWLTLSYPEREIAMLRAAILPDDRKPGGLKELKPEEVNSGVKKLKYSVKMDEKDNNVKYLSAKNDDNHAIIISIKGKDSQFPGTICASVDNGVVKKINIDERDTERALPDVEDFTMYLGTGEEAAKRIRVNLFAGKNHNPCEYDEIILYQVPVASYDKNAKELAAGRIKTTEFGNDTYKGTVDCKENSLLYLSIVDADGWDIYADGKKCKKIDKVNVAFTGVFLPKGTHRIEMVYHTKGFFVGLIITLAGLVIMIAILRIWKGRRGLSS